MKTYKDLMNDNRCPPGMKYDKKLKQCVPKTIRYKGRYILGVPKNKSGGDETPANGNGNGNGNGHGNGNGNGGNGNGGGNGGNGGGE